MDTPGYNEVMANDYTLRGVVGFIAGLWALGVGWFFVFKYWLCVGITNSAFYSDELMLMPSMAFACLACAILAGSVRAAWLAFGFSLAGVGTTLFIFIATWKNIGPCRTCNACNVLLPGAGTFGFPETMCPWYLLSHEIVWISFSGVFFLVSLVMRSHCEKLNSLIAKPRGKKE